MIILGGVDGTAPETWSDRKYHHEFSNSHVRTLCNIWQAGKSNWLRGPVTTDLRRDVSTYNQAKETFRFVMENRKAGNAKAIFLAGYSRGGAAVIEVAKWLSWENIPVECLILFDPVDRTLGVGMSDGSDTPITRNVKKVIYAKRSPLAESRESFGNCGLRTWDGWLTKNKFHKSFQEFLCTHAAMGGVPWGANAVDKETGFINEGFPDGLTKVTLQQELLASQYIRNWSFNLVFDALYECKERLSQPSIPTQPPTKTPVPNPGYGQRVHIVKPGDWLSKIAITYYGDMNRWPVIYDANRSVIGNDPNLIKPGQRLVIP